MTRFRGPLIALLLVPAVAAGAAAQECEVPGSLQDTYTAGGVASELGSAASQTDIVLALGFLAPRGCGGRWWPRADVLAGFRTGAGTFMSTPALGAQLALGGALPTPRVELSDDRRIELVATAGGAGYAAYDMPSAPDELSWIPALQAGAGIRVARFRPEPGMMLVTVVREERFQDWGARTMVRVTWTF